jgi:hypothetical protein
MSFKIVLKPQTVKWRVKVRRPHPDKPGQMDEKSFTCDFVLMGKKEFTALQDDETLSEAARFRQFCKGWDLQGEDGQVLDFANDELVEAVLNVPYMPSAILTAYVDCITGGAARKN